MASNAYTFKPWNVGRWLLWSLYALLLIVAPMMFKSSLALTMLSQAGYLVIICLSYNILLGQGGMLSFGHAVYAGLGSFLAVHAMNLAAKGSFYIPLPLIPLVGGLSGLFFAVLLGYVTTKKAGTTFAMITLGVGESILFESALSFLGLGIQPPTPSWGNMLFNAQELIYQAPFLAILPGVMIFLTVVSFNYLGDGLQDAVDPKAIRR